MGDLHLGQSASGGLHPGGLHRGQGGLADPPVWLQEEGLGRPTRDTYDTMGYGQQAGGTHPTGMHSFSFDVIFELL